MALEWLSVAEQVQDNVLVEDMVIHQILEVVPVFN